MTPAVRLELSIRLRGKATGISCPQFLRGPPLLLLNERRSGAALLFEARGLKRGGRFFFVGVPSARHPAKRFLIDACVHGLLLTADLCFFLLCMPTRLAVDEGKYRSHSRRQKISATFFT